MMDTSTRQPISVSTDGESVPYIMLPVAQLDEVRTLLDANHVRYWVDEEAISIDGKPEVTVINLTRSCNIKSIQRLLDAIP